MSTVANEEAQANLPEIIPKLVGQRQPVRKTRQPGPCKGMLIIVSDDDAHLKDFTDYMP